MRLITVFIVVTAITSGLVYLFPEKAISPGNLLEKHNTLENNCFNCHNLFTGISNEKCESCHIPEKIGLYTVKGAPIDQKVEKIQFHKMLVQGSCVSCHKEHLGETVSKTIEHFSHQMLAKNDLEKCISCHVKPIDRIHRKADQNCMDCHTTISWEATNFDHQQYFRFDKHHPNNCKSCHPSANYNVYRCYDCHEHTPQKIAHEHEEEGIWDYRNCVKCHRSGDEHEAKRIWKQEKKSEKINLKKDKNRKKRKSKKNHRRKHDDEKDDDHDDDD